MNRLLFGLGALVAGALMIPGDADARTFGGGGAHMGGARMGGGGARTMRPPVHGSVGAPGRGFAGRPGGYRPVGGPGHVAGVRPGVGGYRPAGVYGGRYPNYGRYHGRYPYYGRYYGRYPYYGYNYGRYPYYGGWGAAGLATGAAIGAAAASSYPVYQTPAQTGIGGYCATPVRTCALVDSAPIGTGCSCRTSGGRARGTVVAP